VVMGLTFSYQLEAVSVGSMTLHQENP
jgi:hypothetical protein